MACSAKLKMSSVKIHLTPHRKRGGSKKIKIKKQKKNKKTVRITEITAACNGLTGVQCENGFVHGG